ncbi:MAG: bifunctional diguanylate cyclase/phosphodiesterase, partial [Gammaproteobacteria bacterium]|nr:bifunctional diguanylate cyclase/phosphodiesterase [Gammaproteobacteria bacterium]
AAALSPEDPAGGFIACLRSQDDPAFTAADTVALHAVIGRAARSLRERLDPATGLLGWQSFRAEMDLRGAERGPIVVYANLDRMHALNDVAGFDTGDETIARIAGIWRAHSRSAEAVATHLSGDRFAAILFGHTINQARNWAEQVREAVAPPEPGEQNRRVTVSLGIAAMAEGGALQHTLAAAETACRVAKDRGRNRVEIYDDGDHTMIRRHEAVRESDVLIAALDEDRLMLYAQPIVALAPEAKPYHYEILARVRLGDGETVSLGGFLDAAERYQLLERIDRWVVGRAVAMIAPAAHRLHTLGASFAVNLTGQSLSQPEFADFVRTEIKRQEIPRGLIDFELTEVAAARNVAATRRFISRLAEVGARVALDDFGTGVSSLMHLKDLDVFRIKIDGKFVRDILENARSRALIRALVQIADELGLETVAEFVEDAPIAAGVRELGVHYAQGYFYGRALPLVDTLAELCRPAAAGIAAGAA